MSPTQYCATFAGGENVKSTDRVVTCDDNTEPRHDSVHKTFLPQKCLVVRLTERRTRLGRTQRNGYAGVGHTLRVFKRNMRAVVHGHRLEIYTPTTTFTFSLLLISVTNTMIQSNTVNNYECKTTTNSLQCNKSLYHLLSDRRLFNSSA